MTMIVPDDERLEAMAEFAAGAGHEINNPVATIKARVDLLLRGETDPQRRQWLAVIGGQAERIRDMIGDAMLFGRPPQPEKESLELAPVVQSVMDNLAERAGQSGCTLQLTADDDVQVWADPIQLQVVLTELITNSINALSDGGPIRIEIQAADTPVDSCDALIRVTDNGIGLSEIDRKHLFNPFYSGRQAGRGLGFGLPKCWRIVSNHRGRIEVESADGGPTTFSVYWPKPPVSAETGESEESPT
jgi:signal transduction histidine kinase